MEVAGGEQPLEDGLLTENVGTSESVESSPCPCRSGVDDDLGSLSVFSVSPSSVSAFYHSVVKMPASTVCLLCLKCFKYLSSKTKIECLCCNKLSQCSVCMDLNKPCVDILQGFCCKYNECLELAQNGACKVEHNLLESHCLQYLQF